MTNDADAEDHYQKMLVVNFGVLLLVLVPLV